MSPSPTSACWRAFSVSSCAWSAFSALLAVCDEISEIDDESSSTDEACSAAPCESETLASETLRAPAATWSAAMWISLMDCWRFWRICSSAAASWPISSLLSTGTACERSPSAMASARCWRRVRRWLIMRASQRPMRMAMTMTMIEPVIMTTRSLVILSPSVDVSCAAPFVPISAILSKSDERSAPRSWTGLSCGRLSTGAPGCVCACMSAVRAVR